MKEVEVKILEIDQERIRAKLLELGAQKVFAGELWALFYDKPSGEIQSKGDLLRLRKEGEEIRLTYKRPISYGATKIMEETESSVGDWEQMRLILKQLGFEIQKETRKYRTQYDLGSVHIVIDDYKEALDSIPPFLEIEAKNEAALFEVVEQLGFRPEDCKNWNTYELARHYGLVD